jgi:hypothetical protein
MHSAVQRDGDQMTDQVQLPKNPYEHFLAIYPPIMGGDDGAPAAGDGGGDGSQGADGGSGLYDLSNVPDDVRESLMPHLKAIEGNATRKFQEHADYRKGWEPYEQLGVNKVEPQHMADLLELYDGIAQAGSYEDFLKAQAEQYGLLNQEPEGGGELDLNQILNEGQEQGLSQEQINQQINAAVQEAVSPLQEKLTQQEQSAAVAREYEAAGERLDALQREAGIELDEKGQDRVFKLALAFSEGDDPVGDAFKEYQEMVGESESGLLAKKRTEPTPPQGPGGRADTAPPQIKTFEEAGRMARERLRQPTPQ